MTLRNWWAGLSTGLALTVVSVAFYYGLELRRSSSAYEMQMQVLRDMISSTDFGFVVLNPEGAIVEWGPGAEKLFGWKAREVLGSPPDFLMPEEYRKGHNFAMRKEHFRFSPSLVQVDCFAYTKAGELIPIHIVAASFRNHTGYYHAALFTPRDGLRKIDVQPPQAQQKPPPPPQPATEKYPWLQYRK